MSNADLDKPSEDSPKCCMPQIKSKDYCKEAPLCTGCVLLRSKTGSTASACQDCVFSPKFGSLSALMDTCCSPPKCPPPCSPKFLPSEISPPKCPSMLLCDSRLPCPTNCSPKCPPICSPECPPSPLCRPASRSSYCCSPKYLSSSPLCGPVCSPSSNPCTPKCKPPHPFCPKPCDSQLDPVCPTSKFPPRCPACCDVTCFANITPSRCDPNPPPCPPGCQPACPPPSQPICPPGCQPICPPGCQPICPPGYQPICPPGYQPICPPGYQPTCPPGYKPVNTPQCSPCTPCPPVCPPSCALVCPTACPQPCSPCAPPCGPSPVHCCVKDVEEDRPKGFAESVTGPATWDVYGLRFRWTDPACPGACTVKMDQSITVKLCVEVHPSSHLTPDTIRPFCWTHMKTMCNPRGAWRDLPLQYQQDASTVDECGVCRYVYCTSLTPLQDETCKMTFHVRWGKILVWADNNGDYGCC